MAKRGKGGKREGSGRKKKSVNKDPRALMQEMGVCDKWISPIEFCLAVMNNDLEVLQYKAKKGALPEVSIGQRLEAARIAAPYFHQKMPEMSEQKIIHSWADVMKEAEERVRTMRKPDELARQNPSVH